MAAQQWTDKEREVILFMCNGSIQAIRTFYDGVLDGNEDAVDMFKNMLEQAATSENNRPVMSEEQQEDFNNLIDRLRGET